MLPKIFCVQRGGSRPPLFFVHSVMGNVLCYVKLARALGPDQPFYAIQSPGIESELPAAVELTQLATWYIEGIKPHRLGRPFILGGWSMGGVVAFEMAQQLRAAGDPVPLLMLVDSWAPGVNRSDTFLAEANRLNLFANHLRCQRGKISDDAGPLDVDEQLNLILNQARAEQLLGADLGLHHLRKLFDVFSANARAAWAYTPSLNPTPTVLFPAREKSPWFAKDPTLGWTPFLPTLQVVPMPGDHHSLLSQPYVSTLAQAIGQVIQDRTVRRAATGTG